MPLGELVPLIDWSPFFHTWELKGTYPRIFENPEWGARARELFDDAQALLRRIVDERRLTARAVYGFFPANAVGDDIEVYTDEARTGLLTTVHTLRQQMDKGEAEPNQALADFVVPRETGRLDFLGAFAVTTGIGIDPLVQSFEKAHDDYGAIMAKALADRLAEALAEWLHRRARSDWGYGPVENLEPGGADPRALPRASGPLPGIPPARPQREGRCSSTCSTRERNAGISLTESFAMLPAASVSGFYFAHPQSRYFQVGRIERDQVLDYQRRKGMDLRTVERWLASRPRLRARTRRPARPPTACAALAVPRGALA